MIRHTAMMNFLNSHISSPFTVDSLAGDASFRRYHRIVLDDTTYLLMDAPPEKESVVEFVQVAEIMAGAVNVPDIIARDIEQGFLLLQDFGTVEFAHQIAEVGADIDGLYHKALSTLTDLQTLATDINLPPYSPEKLASEMDLFSEWFLPYIGVSLDGVASKLWQQVKDTLIIDIEKQPKVIVHRDYHSRNLMADKASDRIGVIDFQDAVIGAYTYDLVSLVRDAYIDFDETWVNEQIKAFYELKAPSVDLATFTKETNVMGVQRHLKVLGIFIRLSQRDGKDRYLQNIPKVMSDLVHELTWLAKNDDNEIYGAFLVWLNDGVMPAYRAKFGV